MIPSCSRLRHKAFRSKEHWKVELSQFYSRLTVGGCDTRELLKLDYNKGIVVHSSPNISISTYLKYNIHAVKEYDMLQTIQIPVLSIIIIRLSDVNKPGVEVDDLKRQEVEMHPRIVDTQGWNRCKPIFSKIVSLHAESNASGSSCQVLGVIGQLPKVHTGRYFRMYREALATFREVSNLTDSLPTFLHLMQPQPIYICIIFTESKYICFNCTTLTHIDLSMSIAVLVNRTTFNYSNSEVLKPQEWLLSPPQTLQFQRTAYTVRLLKPYSARVVDRSAVIEHLPMLPSSLQCDAKAKDSFENLKGNVIWAVQ
ncbi:hypothetical protein DFJ58DRAFT_837860 [Suillus subalutaceus]|uniref:uncharacterized protein n=1 Tax=Suillus subalutaceus TaxID=48586 RepID=UPI001B86B1CE|nr:uncharacterized protein DFJ58DRAFT_837860 [Suillus subalutaceus]KAG1869045.1 hypothetical protein DFJ58DRAFT_837860 [Suillus subalutaceus]